MTIPNKLMEVSCEKGGMSRNFLSFHVEFRKFLVPNPLDGDLVVPMYVRHEYDTMHINYTNIHWCYYALEFDHRRVGDGQWVLSSFVTALSQRDASSRGYEVFGFPDFTILYFIAFAMTSSKVPEILGGFTLSSDPDVMFNKKSESIEHSDRVFNYLKFCDEHIFRMKPNLTVRGTYLQRIYSFGYIYHKLLDGVLSLVSANDRYLDYNDLSKRMPKLTNGELHTLIATASIIEGAHRGDMEPEHSYHFELLQDYDPNNMLSAWRFLHLSESGKDPIDPYTTLLNDTKDILDTDTSSLSSSSTTTTSELELSSPYLDTFFDTSDFDLSLMKVDELEI